MPFVIGPEQLAVAVLGVVVGIIFGAIPGMTATMAVAVFLPLTYAYSLETAMYLLLGLYVGGISGGLVPAILINIPGTPSSLTTTFDGHPMALRGESERALKIGITSSFIGGMISLGVLALFTPVLAGWAIKFSAVEKFLIILFAFTQLFEECEIGMKAHFSKENAAGITENVKFKFGRDFKGQGINVIRSALIGTFAGILPGVGGSAASILAYSQAKSFSKHPELMGTGVAEGLVASETSNNGLTGGALVPLLSLGIPGDSTTAVLIGAFMLQGIQVGPLFITNNPVAWNTILMALLVCNVIMYAVMFFPIKWISKIIYIPRQRLYPVIIMMCVVGAYTTINGRMFDVWGLLLFGVIGFLFKKFHFPSTCFLIGFILGSDLENYFIQAISSMQGSLAVFFSRPIGLVIWVLIVVSVIYAVMDSRKDKKKAQ